MAATRVEHDIEPGVDRRPIRRRQRRCVRRFGCIRCVGCVRRRGPTIGTVKLVDGTSVYVQDLQGNTIKVTTKPTTTVSVSKTGKASDLAPGSAVIVQGTPSADGTSMAATSISQTTGVGGGGGFGAGRGAGG